MIEPANWDYATVFASGRGLPQTDPALGYPTDTATCKPKGTLDVGPSNVDKIEIHQPAPREGGSVDCDMRRG